jgi:hypothetical protein
VVQQKNKNPVFEWRLDFRKRTVLIQNLSIQLGLAFLGVSSVLFFFGGETTRTHGAVLGGAWVAGVLFIVFGCGWGMKRRTMLRGAFRREFGFFQKNNEK